MSVCCLFAEVDWFLPVAKGMIQRLEELCRFDSYFSLLELFIILILILTRLVTSTHRLRQIIFKLSLIFASLFAISLLPLADTLTQLCSKLYLLLHPLQLLQKLIHCQLRGNIEHFPADGERTLHKLLIAQRFDVGNDIQDSFVELGGILDEHIMYDPEVELNRLAFYLFLVEGRLAPAYLSNDSHRFTAILQSFEIVLQLPERQHNSNQQQQDRQVVSVMVHLRFDQRLTNSSLLRVFTTRTSKFHFPFIYY